MRKILTRLFLLLIIPGILVFFSLVLPPSKSFTKSMMFAQLDKNRLLKETKSPRIIFVGGSNVSFGLDSKRIKDSLNINPINTGISAGIGLKYMLANTAEYIREKDIVILSPEYHQFYGDFADGDLDLLSMLVDVPQQSFKLLDNRQRFKLCKYLPEFSSSKYIGFFKNESNTTSDSIGIYDRLSFNGYGDAYIHWKLPKQKFSIYDFKGAFNDDIVNSLIQFRDLVNSKQARLFITFPCFEESSFEYSEMRIKEVERKLREKDFILISEPEEYKMPDSLMFESAYHLNKIGVDYRTELMIKDIKTSCK